MQQYPEAIQDYLHCLAGRKQTVSINFENNSVVTKCNGCNASLSIHQKDAPSTSLRTLSRHFGVDKAGRSSSHRQKCAWFIEKVGEEYTIKEDFPTIQSVFKSSTMNDSASHNILPSQQFTFDNQNVCECLL